MYELVKEVRGKGTMIGMEFGDPRSLSLKATWSMLETASKGLFCQMITIPLFTQHGILSQVAGHGMHVVKFLPPLILTDDDYRWIIEAVSDVVAEAHRVPSSIWNLGKTLASHAIRTRTAATA